MKKAGKVKQTKPGTRKIGRPSVYTDTLGQAICNRLAAGESLRSICRDAKIPQERAVRRWAMMPDHPFAEMYDRARNIGLDTMADEIIEIADTPWLGKRRKISGTGKNRTVEITEGDMIERSRLMVDVRKWYLSKLAPKRYGDRMALEHSGSLTLEQLVAESYGAVSNDNGTTRSTEDDAPARMH